MSPSKLFVASIVLALLVSCEARIGKEADKNSAESAAATAEKAEAGKFSINAPGFNMKIDIPDALAKHATINSDSDIVYPGAQMSGLHIDAEDDKGTDGVAIRFTSGDAPAKIADWYQDKQRGDKFTIGSAQQEKDGYRLEGHEKGDSGWFLVQLRPAEGGGTEGVLTLRDHD